MHAGVVGVARSVGGAGSQKTSGASRVEVRLKARRPSIQREPRLEGRRDRSGRIHLIVQKSEFFLKMVVSAGGFVLNCQGKG
jgi:hypothetical protein